MWRGRENLFLHLGLVVVEDSLLEVVRGPLVAHGEDGGNVVEDVIGDHRVIAEVVNFILAREVGDGDVVVRINLLVEEAVLSSLVKLELLESLENVLGGEGEVLDFLVVEGELVVDPEELLVAESEVDVLEVLVGRIHLIRLDHQEEGHLVEVEVSLVDQASLLRE